MNRFGRRELIFLAVCGVAFVIVGGYWTMHRNTPEPATSTHQIAAGGFEQVIVGNKRSGIRGTGRPPYRLEFKSSGGPVDVYVTPVTLGYRAKYQEHIDKLTDEFAAGQAPEDIVAKSSGNRGKIVLRSWWQGWFERTKPGAAYLVLIRSKTDSEVTLVVHYGP